MSGRRFALLDPAAGISGDMLLGALLDLGAPPEWIQGLPGRLGLTDVTIEIADTVRCSIRAKKVTVRLGLATEDPGDVSERDLRGLRDHGHTQALDEPHHHGGTHHRHDHGAHPHRHVGELVAMIAQAQLSPWVKELATRAFQLLAEAEGRIHGVAANDVALHEVGAFDALVDIVGAIEGFEQIGVTEVYSRPVALGNGWVRAAHGVLPVPTPATSLLVEGLAIAPDGPIMGEATTPTGAVLLRVLTSNEMPVGQWRPLRTGWGAGGRDPTNYPNALRVVIGELAADLDEELVVLSTDLDDLSPEYLEPLREGLVGAGAVDVVTWSTQMKKGRIGFRIEALAPIDRADQVTDAFFRHSTTAGVRRCAVSRRALARDHWSLQEPGGDTVRFKTLHGPDGPRVKPEYDDVIAVARRTGQPAHELSHRLQQQALGLVGGKPAVARGVDIAPKKES